MGLPTTWVLLNVIHLFWIEEAVSVDPNPIRRNVFRLRAAICGDDLVSHWPLAVSMRYH